MSALNRFLGNEDGPTVVEYAVLLALILGAVIAAVGVFGQASGGLWQNNSTQLNNAMNGGS